MILLKMLILLQLLLVYELTVVIQVVDNVSDFEASSLLYILQFSCLVFTFWTQFSH